MARRLCGIRSGVTLVELLVVMMIMLILATIVVAFAPGFQDAQKVGRGADQLQGWLLTARQWAKKDRLPTGLRLSVTNGASTGFVTDLQYIQQPSTFIVPYGVPAQPPGQQPIARRIGITPLTATTSQASLDTGWTASPQVGAQIPGDFLGGGTNPIQIGDYLVLHETIYSVTAITATQLTLGSGLATAITSIPATTDYYFVRSPRALTGESTLKLPQDVAIDMTSTSATNIAANSQGYVDILFSPSGEVLAPTMTSIGKVVLWIKDSTKPAGYTNDTLIAIDMRTGLIASQPVNLSGGDPYLYTKDGRSSGL